MAVKDIHYEIDTTELVLETLSGDIRDTLLTHIRSMGNPWAKMSEQEQQDKIDACTQSARSLVRQASHIIGAKGFDSIGITIGKFASKDGVITAQFETVQTHDSLIKISDMQNRRSLLVLVDPDDYDGERAPAEPDKDQPEMPLAAE
jgi:ElaB/YqjD/DUF883 family membrane-anchored ribosome-binding protein